MTCAEVVDWYAHQLKAIEFVKRHEKSLHACPAVGTDSRYRLDGKRPSKKFCEALAKERRQACRLDTCNICVWSHIATLNGPHASRQRKKGRRPQKISSALFSSPKTWQRPYRVPPYAALFSTAVPFCFSLTCINFFYYTTVIVEGWWGRRKSNQTVQTVPTRRSCPWTPNFSGRRWQFPVPNARAFWDCYQTTSRKTLAILATGSSKESGFRSFWSLPSISPPRLLSEKPGRNILTR